ERSCPTRRSGCVTSPTTGCGPFSSAKNVGSANVPEPIITNRIVINGNRNQCHGWNTDETRIRFRVLSVFNPWPTLLLCTCLQGREQLFDLLVRRNVAAFLGFLVIAL